MLPKGSEEASEELTTDYEVRENTEYISVSKVNDELVAKAHLSLKTLHQSEA